jgi:hypothetical protein
MMPCFPWDEVVDQWHRVPGPLFAGFSFRNEAGGCAFLPYSAAVQGGVYNVQRGRRRRC